MRTRTGDPRMSPLASAAAWSLTNGIRVALDGIEAGQLGAARSTQSSIGAAVASVMPEAAMREHAASQTDVSR